MDQLELNRMLRAADITEIRMLHGKYLAYLDQINFLGIYGLMAQDHPEVSYEMVEAGRYEGPDSVRAFMVEAHRVVNTPSHNRGWIGLQYLFTPRIVLNEDGTRARAQWNQLSPHAMQVTPQPGNRRLFTPYWFIGKYDNEYIKIDDEWKLLKTHIIAFSRTPYDQGWVKEPDARRIFHAYANPPEGPSRVYAYHSDALYTANRNYNWGPHLPRDGKF